jgi:methylated-DNA-[protein]-cysteine S-methyltransferase
MGDVLELLIDRIDTPIGEMILVADHDGNLRAADWTEHEPRMRNLLRLHYGKDGFTLTPARNPNGLAHAIGSYFAGDLAAIDIVPVQTNGTPFQREVWRALRKITCGATLSYAKLAEQIGRPTAVRAAGLANGSNPIGIVVPCHRVIGSNGSLTGYGGGMQRKRWLLEHERSCAPSVQLLAMAGKASGVVTQKNCHSEPERSRMGKNPRIFAFALALAPALAPAPAPAPVLALAVAVARPLPPNQRTVISTEAAHAFVSSAVEKSASLPPPCANRYSALAVAFAYASLQLLPMQLRLQWSRNRCRVQVTRSTSLFLVPGQACALASR